MCEAKKSGQFFPGNPNLSGCEFQICPNGIYKKNKINLKQAGSAILLLLLSFLFLFAFGGVTEIYESFIILNYFLLTRFSRVIGAHFFFSLRNVVNEGERNRGRK